MSTHCNDLTAAMVQALKPVIHAELSKKTHAATIIASLGMTAGALAESLGRLHGLTPEMTMNGLDLSVTAGLHLCRTEPPV